MSLMRIGSIEFSVLVILAVLKFSPTEVSSMVPLGFSVGIPGESLSKIVNLHLGLGTHSPGDADQNLLGLVVDVGDKAVRTIEDGVLGSFQLVALLAEDGRERSRWRAKSSSFCLMRCVRF